MGVLGGAFGFIGSILGVIFGIVREVVFPVVGFLMDIFFPVLSTMFQIFSAVFSIIAGIFKLGFGALKDMVDILVEFFNPAWQETKALIKMIGGAIYTFLETPIKFVAGLLAEMLGVIVDIVNFVGGSAKGLEGTVSKMRQYAGTESVSEKDKRLTDEALKQSVAASAAKSALVSQKDSTARVVPPKPGNQPPINLDAKTTINTNLKVDGRHMSAATSRHQTEVQERAGFNETPWQKQLVQVSGANSR
jgi:hypothetical protein